MYQRPNQFWIIWSVILLDRLKNSFFILIGAFMIKAEMCELLLSFLKVFWSIKVRHKQHLCEIMKPWCGRDLATSKLSTLRILIKYKLLSERQIYINSHEAVVVQAWLLRIAKLCLTSCMALYLWAESKNVLSQTFNFAKKFLSIFLPSYDPKKISFYHTSDTLKFQPTRDPVFKTGVPRLRPQHFQEGCIAGRLQV